MPSARMAGAAEYSSLATRQGVKLVQPYVNVIEGRYYKPAVHEVMVSDPIRKMYKGA